MGELESLRERIDEADEALLEALANRMRIVDQILQEKETNGLPLFDSEREMDLLARFGRGAADKELDPRLAQRVLREVISYSREVQARRVQEGHNPELSRVARVAYQGTKGAYSWLACRKHFGEGVDPVGYPSFPEAVKALEEGRVDLALLPIENSLAGSIFDVYDLLAHSRLHVVGEEILRVEHCLIGLRGVPLEQIRAVLSHPVALQQCTAFVQHLPNATYQSYIDSAEAVRKIREDGDPTKTAIASREAAELYDLEVLQEGIADHPENYTRFWLVGREPVTVDLRIPARTSLILVTEHREGALVACLACLAAQGINLTKLESRPRHGMPWQYQFHLDMDGNIAEERMRRALDDVRARSRVLRILGCYPRAGATDTAPEAEVARVSARLDAARVAAESTEILSDRSHRKRTVVWVGEVALGDGDFVVLAGPPAVESASQMREVAALVKASGAQVLQVVRDEGQDEASFHGLGTPGIKLLLQAGKDEGLPVVCEVLAPEDVLSLARVANMLAVGSRNMQNLPLLRALGRAGCPVLLKRGMSSTVKELLKAAEYILAEGNQQVVLCEGGIRTFETSTESTLDLAAVVSLKEQTHLPVVVDPSQAVGHATWVPPLAKAVRALGADGIVIEVHSPNGGPLPDAETALDPEMFSQLMRSLKSG